MGQLEKYGLYVLCLVIFLILGVALWGEPAAAADSAARRGAVPNTAPARVQADTFDLADLGQLLQPAADSRRTSGADNQRPAVDPVQPPAAATVEPSGTPPAPVAAPRVHRISQGDTFESIAKQALGDARHVGLLRELNPDVLPERMRIGKELKLPTAVQLQAGSVPTPGSTPAADKSAADKSAADKPGTDKRVAKAPERAEKEAPKAKRAPANRTHKIVRGDTLEELARHYLGSPKRVDDIKRLNPAVDPTRLRIGQVIRLPD